MPMARIDGCRYRGKFVAQLGSDVEAQIDRNVTLQTLVGYVSSRTAFPTAPDLSKVRGLFRSNGSKSRWAPDANKPENRVFVVLVLDGPSWRVVKFRLPRETLQYIAAGKGLRPSRR